MRRAMIRVSVVVVMMLAGLGTWRSAHRRVLLPGMYSTEVVQASCRLRSVLGFGPREMAMCGVDSGDYGEIALAAAEYCNEQMATIGPLVEGVNAAARARMRAYELNEDVSGPSATLASGIESLATAGAAAVGAMSGVLREPQRAIQDRRRAHPLLDPELAALDLSGGQAAALASAQQARDLVHLHHSQRKDLPRVAGAQEAFQAAVAATLSGEQATELAALRTARNEGMAELLSAERVILRNGLGD